ncbi:MAG: pyridoxamine 5'-phosphate oxidase family protein [Actinomycetota bacterium]
MNNSTTSTTPTDPGDDERHRRRILATIARRSFCVVATTSSAGRPHAAGVVYDHHAERLWFHTRTDSRKGRNLAANPWAAVTIPFRRLPAGPPFTIHFQARAELLALDAPDVTAAIDAGALKGISGHGALDMPGSCFVRLAPVGSIHSYGPGARTLDLIRDPLNHGAASFPVAATAAGGRS